METEQVLEMITIREASNRTGISYDCLRKMCLKKQIVFIRCGAKFLINWEKLKEYLNGGQAIET